MSHGFALRLFTSLSN